MSKIESEEEVKPKTRPHRAAATKVAKPADSSDSENQSSEEDIKEGDQQKEQARKNIASASAVNADSSER